MSNTANIKLLMDLDDKASGKLQKVDSSLNSFQDRVEAMQPAFKAMAAAGAAAFTAISGEIYTAITSYNEAMKVEKQLEAVLKSTAGAAGFAKQEILDYSSALQKMTTYDDEAITSASNLLLTFTNIKGPVFKDAIATILDMSTALGQDLKSSAIQVGKALNNPVEGVSALQRVGVNFTEQQKEMIATMVESGKTIEAQKFILKELATEFGGSAAAQADTFAGKILQLQNRLGDLQEKIGGALVPVIMQFADKIQPIVDRIISWIDKNPELSAQILIMGAAISALVVVLGTVGMLLASTGGVIGLVIGAVVAAGYAIYKFRDSILEVFNYIDEKTGLITLFQWAFDTLATVFREEMMPALTEFLEALKPLQPLLDPILQVSIMIAKIFGGALLVAVYAAVISLTKLTEGLAYVMTVATKFETAVLEYLSGPIEVFVEIVKDAVNWVEKLLNKIGEIGGGAIGGVKKMLTKSLEGKATGGPVSGGTPYIVGERGPELFVPSRTGSIVPNHALASGGGINITITGNSFMGKEGVAREIGKEIMRELGLREKLSY